MLEFGQAELAPALDGDVMVMGAAGAALRAARCAGGLSLEDVARQTRIAARHIDALEQSRYDAFVSPVYSVGFAKCYARLVGLSETWVSQSIRADLAELQPCVEAVEPVIQPQPRPQLRRAAPIALLALAGVASLVCLALSIGRVLV
jgi:cytoskeletal protein RodZ